MGEEIDYYFGEAVVVVEVVLWRLIVVLGGRLLAAWVVSKHGVVR